jgi:hypothetical protein
VEYASGIHFTTQMSVVPTKLPFEPCESYPAEDYACSRAV